MSSNTKPNEHILCAAIHYKDGRKYEHTVKNIESGLVICGRRHHNCILLLSQVLGDAYDKTLIGREGQGFITSFDRFVSRKEAFIIAKREGQIWHDLHDENDNDCILISEDLY
jgi:hypothetical protein